MNLWGKIILKNLSIRRRGIIMAVIFIFTLTNQAFSQQVKDSLSSDSLKIALDSIKISDTAAKDTIAQKSLADSLGIRISPDALPDIVLAEATDSAVLNMNDKKFYLYGNAKINYQDLQLTAGVVNLDNA